MIPGGTFDVDGAGRVTAQIADAKGELHPYTIARVPDPEAMGRLCIGLTRLDTTMSYLVVFRPGLGWRCNCPDSTYRRERRGECKHCECAAAYHSLLQHLAQEIQHVR